MKRKEYPIHPDFMPLAKLNPPLNRALLPLMQKSMGSLWRLERSGDGVVVEKIQIRRDKGEIMRALLYSPEGMERGSGSLPCLVCYHGGGFVFNAAPYHFHNAREYCRNARCRVLLVDYRLAPAHVFPAALDDAFAAYRWAQTRADELDIDVSRIAVGGDSAGGSLAAGVCLMARDYGAAVPCGQLLVYPAVGAGEVTQSVLEFTDTPMCNSRDMEKYIKFYNPNCDSLSPQERRYSSPGEAEKLDGLPETYVETAEFDCLHDEGVLYAKRLEEEGIPVTLNETKGTIHGYDFMTKSEITRQSIQKRCEFLKKIFYSDREI